MVVPLESCHKIGLASLNLFDVLDALGSCLTFLLMESKEDKLDIIIGMVGADAVTAIRSKCVLTSWSKMVI